MSYTPRLDDTGILNNFHWYSDNPLYQAGYGMPNCTCYAWGRFWEIGDPNGTGEHKPVNLPVSDGGSWWGDNISSGAYNYGITPELGAVICFSDNYGGSGHVAIVEEIDSIGNLTCSNSAWQSTYFFLSSVYASDGYDWSHYTFQGFIYNPYADQPTPPTPTTERKKRHFPWVLYAKKLRDKRGLRK